MERNRVREEIFESMDSGEWIKERCVYIYKSILFSFRNKEFLFFVVVCVDLKALW